MPEDRSTPALMGDLIESVTQLVRKEIQLFRAEMGEKATQTMVAAGGVACCGRDRSHRGQRAGLQHWSRPSRTPRIPGPGPR